MGVHRLPFRRCSSLAVLLCLAACQGKTPVQTPAADSKPVSEPVAVGSSDAKLESGLDVGASVAAFQVVKAGGIEDGVPVGKELCYR